MLWFLKKHPGPLFFRLHHNLGDYGRLELNTKEYIQHLQQIYRWCSPSNNIEVGSLVLLKDPLPATKWPMTRVLEVIKGSDNLTRVANIKTGTGNYTRPIVKLVPLPIAPIQDS